MVSWCFLPDGCLREIFDVYNLEIGIAKAILIYFKFVLKDDSALSKIYVPTSSVPTVKIYVFIGLIGRRVCRYELSLWYYNIKVQQRGIAEGCDTPEIRCTFCGTSKRCVEISEICTNHLKSHDIMLNYWELILSSVL